MKKVLISGATGFIGRNCLPILLQKGYEVHVVSSKVSSKILPDVHYHQFDLLDPEQCTKLMNSVKPSHLLHLAWYVVPGKRWWSSLEHFKWMHASLTMLKLFEQAGGERVVITGTCFEYDLRYGYCSDSITPLAPSTFYGKCKHSLQIMLDGFGKETELSNAWARIFFLYGPYEYPERLVSSVSSSLVQGKPALCSHSNQIRDFLYVKDVADALVEVLDSDIQGSVNIGSGQAITLKDIIFTIAKKLGRQDLIRLGAVSVPADEPHLLVADVNRLFEEVGWRPKYDLEYGLEQTVEWWQERINNINGGR